MKTYLLTLDYELWGDGSGNIFDLMIVPTQKILDLCDRNGVKLTIFFEFIEYLKIKEQWEQGNSMGYSENPLLAIENQLKNAIAAGHDVQLHFHPQWCHAQWQNDHWITDDKNWRLGDYQPENGMTLDQLFKAGKNLLESWFIPIRSDYQCLALRAGGYNILPCDDVIRTMRKYGILLDSSVYNGGYEHGYLSRYDFRTVKDTLGYWAFSGDVRKADAGGDLYELPVLALPMRRQIKYCRLDKLLNMLKNVKKTKNTLVQRSETVQAEQGLMKKLFSKVKFILEKESQNWDVTVISPGMQRKFLNLTDSLEKQHERKIFTIIGHPKCLKSTDTLQELLKGANQPSACNFSTVTDFYRTEIAHQNKDH